MIPLRLTIEGIYSYQERQTIDFEALTQAGFFGIFGAVGSGKSSLLEAITYALYGETERLNARDKRAYNMMNLKSNRSYIELDFINFENRMYRVTREFRRNSKNFEDVKSPTVVLYEKINEQWVPLESSNVQPIIGLTYENFKRTIIIPQGQFKEFIELGAKERTDMMKDIFQLHRFDLQDKVSILFKKNQSELDQLDGQLIAFEEITPERIETTLFQLTAERVAFLEAEKSSKALQQKFQALKNLKQDFLERADMKARFQSLNQQKPEMELLRQQLSLFEEAQSAFSHTLQMKERLDRENSDEQIRLKHEERIGMDMQKRIGQSETQLKEMKRHYELLPERRISEIDLELILQLITFSDEIKGLKDRAKRGRDFVLQAQVQQLQCKTEIQQTTAALAGLKKSKPSANELMELGHWYTRQQTLQQQEAELQRSDQELIASTAMLKKQLEEIDVNATDFQLRYTEEMLALENRMNELNIEKTHLLLQQKLTQFAENLTAGSPCPLCGAIEHPALAENLDITQDIVQNQLLIAETNDAIKTHTEKKFEIEKIRYQLQSLQNQRDELNKKISENKSSKITHFQQFAWPQYSSTDESIYLVKRQQLSTIESEIAEKEQTLSNLQSTLTSIEEKLERYNQKLKEFELQEASKQAQISQNVGNLKRLQWKEYERKEYSEVALEYSELKNANLQLERDFNTLTDELNGLNSQFSAQNSLIKTIKDRLLKIETERIQGEHALQKLLAVSSFETLEQVRQTLAQELPIQKIRKELEQFQVQFESLKAQILNLDHKLADQVYDEQTFIEEEAKVEESFSQLKFHTENVAKYEQEHSQLEASYTKKQLLQEQHIKLSLRHDHIKQISNLFKGAGFVQYVSSIYLRQLCDHANMRFHRMTRNQLSLQISDSNEFEIIDYLNEGKSRSVKTLSGGQAFQVSLSLALALAESVQSNNQAAKNFFFIDEGFGTQDIASVNIVFETLLDLHKENRIVGIISHVEELKERIPISLSIEKDEQRGSQIFIN